MKELEYPFDSQFIMRKRKSLKRQLVSQNNLVEKKIAVLGGSTTHDIVEMIELFLLNQGISPVFYESEYARYWEDAMFENPKLCEFCPDVIYVHISNRNIQNWPEITDSKEEIERKLQDTYNHFLCMWEKLAESFHCPVIQNNFEYPFYRLQGNRDVTDIHGRVNFVSRLNILFSEYAEQHDSFYINDLNYQSADFGLSKWSDPYCWHMYKYALSLDAIPVLAFNVSNMIKSLFGKNKKACAIDLDNTLWGGVVGDDGPENLEIGNETSIGQAYLEFQKYLKELKNRGILLNIISKNEPENALAGLNHPEMVLKKEDFIIIKANWEPKSENLAQMAKDLSLLPESFVFIDDNPAEREIIRRHFPDTGIPELVSIEQYISAIDKAGYFEVTSLSGDDLKRNEMYRDNLRRSEQEKQFADYHEYLLSLKMVAVIEHFNELVLDRVAQLTNKSNQFNLTTVRYTREEIEAISNDNQYITLYGRLSDCFGDNGIVSVVIGKINEDTLDIILWLMSCRVLKRNMEYAMMDELVLQSQNNGIKTIKGYYYPTAKNKMVKDFYKDMGFCKLSEDENGSSEWVLNLTEEYQKKNSVILVNNKEK